jgi:hypothetical protein
MQKVAQALYLREARFGKGRGVGSKFLICGRVSSMIWFAAVNTVPALARTGFTSPMKFLERR